MREWKKSYSTEKQKELIQCMAVGDLDNDGKSEVVLGLNLRPLAGIQSYAVQILDNNGNKKQRWDSTYPVNDVTIVDINDDGTAEILVSTADLYVLSNRGQNLNYPPIGTVVSAAVAEDLDNNGEKELLVGTREVICRSSTLNWTVPIGSQIRKIIVGDVNWDTHPDVVVLTTQNVHVLDRNGTKLWISPGTQNLRDMAVANIDGDRNLEILFSVDNMRISIWEAREEGLEREIDLQSYKADFLAVADLNKDGTLEIVVASSKLRLEILDLNGNSLLQYRFEQVSGNDIFVDMALKDMTGDTWTDILLAHSIDSTTGGEDSFLYLMENQWKAPPPSRGNELYTEAVNFYNEGDCSEAVSLFTQAQTAFLQEGNQEMADECQSYIDECKDVLTVQEEADSTFLQAEALFQRGDFEEAKILYEQAQSLYEELGDSEKVQTCLGRIAEIEGKMVPVTEAPPEEVPQKKGTGLLLVIVVAAVVLLGVGSYVLMKRRGPGRVPEERVPEEKPERIEELEEFEKPESVRKEIREEERKLKAKFVYGEINKEEYQEKLTKLYENES